MGAAYCTADDIKAQAFEELNDAEDDLLDQLAEAASRIFDRAAEAPEGYFAAAADDSTPATRIFYGEGTDSLSLPPYVPGTLSDVALPDGLPEIEFIEDSTQFILTRAYITPLSLSLTDPTYWPGRNDWQRRSSMGWPAGVAISVTARWGFGAVPGDVRQAVIQTAVLIFRDVDPARTAAADLEGQSVAADMPAMAKMVAEKWRERGLVYGN